MTPVFDPPKSRAEGAQLTRGSVRGEMGRGNEQACAGHAARGRCVGSPRAPVRVLTRDAPAHKLVRGKT